MTMDSIVLYLPCENCGRDISLYRAGAYGAAGIFFF